MAPINPHPKRIAVFASGNGSNAENIIRYFNCDPANGARVELVVCNRPGAGVIDKAAKAGVPVAILSREQINDPQLMPGILAAHKIDLIVLAGFLLMVPAFILEAYPDRVVNIHPSLLPKYGGKGMYGGRIHRAVVEAGETQTGITIHYVSEQCDEGRVIFQATMDIAPDDTPEDVERGIHRLEQLHFPRVIRDSLVRRDSCPG